MAADYDLDTMEGARHCPPGKADSDFGGEPASDRSMQFVDFKDFCKRTPAAVLCIGHSGRKMKWTEVAQIDAVLRARFQYRDDQDTHHVEDYWSNWSVCGDCEDYALTLSEMLAQAGEDGWYMRLTFETILYETASGMRSFGHAALFVETADAGMIEVDVSDPPRVPSKSSHVEFPEAYVRMDGNRVVVPMEGYVLVDSGTAVDAIASR